MKRRLLIVLVLIGTVLMVACKNGLPRFSEESVKLTIAECSKPNFVTLKCEVPGEGYDSIIWILPDGQQFSQLSTFTVYFPNKGEYEVKVAIIKGGNCCHNDYLLNGILKKDWNFDNVAVTDWGGAHDTKEVIYNGLDLEMGTWTDGFSWNKCLLLIVPVFL